SYWPMLLIMAAASTSLPKRGAEVLIARLKLGEGPALLIRTVFAFAVLLLSVAFLVGDTYNPFLYFRF
ncbi:MAG: MBOAT family protein, partial [Oscillospiraceae bacterium]|nr:MBOAT family protein [Oscillospiraceae bacterium]